MEKSASLRSCNHRRERERVAGHVTVEKEKQPAYRNYEVSVSLSLVDSADYPRKGIVCRKKLAGGSSILRIDSVCRRAWVRARLARDHDDDRPTSRPSVFPRRLMNSPVVSFFVALERNGKGEHVNFIFHLFNIEG